MDFVKDVWNIEISGQERKKKPVLFLQMFFNVTFLLETFPTNMTFATWFIWLLIWKRHLWQCNVKSIENISRRNKNHKTLAKKALVFFGSLLEISIFQTSFTNPNLKLMAGFSNNHYCSYTFLNPLALKQFLFLIW